MVEAQHDFIGLENSSQFEQQLFTTKLEATHEIIPLVLGPQHGGWPGRRTRCHMVA